MGADLQGSLLDAFEDPALGSLDGLGRTELGRGAWIDVLPGWLTGRIRCTERLARDVPWQAERRQMYDRVVDVPRLLCFYGENEDLPLPILDEAREALSARTPRSWASRSGPRGCALPGRPDSVAWHGDRIGAWQPRGTRWWRSCPSVSHGCSRCGRGRMADPPAVGYDCPISAGHGDLIVMGGSCQRTLGARDPQGVGSGSVRGISIQFRPRAVR
jgi:hypothetical protein